jgi:hypothetical protein
MIHITSDIFLCILDTSLKFMYSLRPILLFHNTDVSTTKICLDTSILAKSIMDRREYYFLVTKFPIFGGK